MAGIFDMFSGGGNQTAKEDEKFIKNAAKIQDFVNKYNIRSRDLTAAPQEDVQAYTPGFQSYAWIDDATATSNNRAIRYKEYREMMSVPELNQSINIYADNATQYSIKGDVMEIESGNNKIIEILEKLFFDNLDMNSNLWKIVRNTCKLGDEFLEVVLDNPDSPKHIISLERIKHPENIKKIEKDGSLIGFKYEFDEEDKKPQMFQPWQIIHFKIEDEEFDPYGKSVLESGRKTFKKLTLMEDAMLVYRISRAPERRVFYVDVGTMPTKEANKFMETLKRQFRKKKYINQHTGEVDEKANPLCITLDTKIDLLDGRSVELKQLIEEQNNGKENWVYSIDRENNNQIVPGKIVWAGETRQNAELVEVILDNAEKLRVTPDHKFMLRDGSYCEAKDLTSGISLMPLYKKLSTQKNINGYEQIYNPSDEKYEFTHRIVARNVSPDLWNNTDKRTVHHVNFNKLDNSPKNLKVMGFFEHRKYHTTILEKTLHREDVKARIKENIIAMNKTISHRDKGYASSEDWLIENNLPTKSKKSLYQNHKVLEVKFLNYTEDTGCITVEKYHNFATSAGVFIKNSVDEDFYIPVRQNSQGTRIETLPGGQNLGEVDDVRYFKDMILKTMGIPSGYLGGSSAEGAAGSYDPKSYLSNQEVQFSRTIERVQKLIIRGLEKIAFIELILTKFEKSEIKDFKIKLTPPSNVDQLMEIEIRNQQFALIQQVRSLENFLPDEWIYGEILGMNEQQIQKIRLQLQMQQQMALQLQSITGGQQQGMDMGSGAAMGGNIMGGAPPGAEAGGPPEGAAETPAEPGLEVASNMIEFDGAKWLMENQKDVEKLLKYVKLYEKVHKDNKGKISERRNSATRMLIEGEFRGLVKAYQSSNEIILREERILLGTMKKKKASRNKTSNT